MVIAIAKHHSVCLHWRPLAFNVNVVKALYSDIPYGHQVDGWFCRLFVGSRVANHGTIPRVVPVVFHPPVNHWIGSKSLTTAAVPSLFCWFYYSLCSMDHYAGTPIRIFLSYGYVFRPSHFSSRFVN